MNLFPVEYVFSSLPQGSYADPAACTRQVVALINEFPTLYPEILSGNSVVAIKGTIPIEYNHQRYHFPVEIALPVYYPTESPEVKVVPNSELKILPGHRHVDQSGKVYLAYISNWNMQAQSCLVDMVRQLQIEFSKLPPLYSPQSSLSPQSMVPPPPSYPNHHQVVPPPPVYRSNVPPPPVYCAPSPVPLPPTAASQPTLVHSNSGHGKLFKNRCVDKIRFRLETVLPKTQQECQLELERAEKLQDNSDELERRLQQVLECEKALEAQLLMVHHAQILMQGQIAQHEQHKESVEDLVGFPFDLSSQTLLQSLADSLAIEDALYQINLRLQRGEIDLRLFLRLTRNLSREQFFKSALAIKLHQSQPPCNGFNRPAPHPTVSSYHRKVSN